MGFRDLFGKKTEIDVITDKDAYLPGDVVTATVRITAKKELEVEEGRAELVYENEYEYQQREWDSDWGSDSDWDSDSGRDIDTERTTDRVTHDRQRFLEAGTLAGGTTSEHTVSFRLPSAAIPSGEGRITSVRWKVEATLAVGRGLDPDGNAVLKVLSPPDAYAEWTEREPELDTHGDCDLDLSLPAGRNLGAGETVSGTLVVRPREPLEVSEVRAELARRERVPRGEGNDDEAVGAKTVLAGATKFAAGTPREFPFELTVPTDVCPSLRTEHSTVRWELRGVLSRRLRSDYNIRQEVNVYTASGEAAAREQVAPAGDAETS